VRGTTTLTRPSATLSLRERGARRRPPLPSTPHSGLRTPHLILAPSYRARPRPQGPAFTRLHALVLGRCARPVGAVWARSRAPPAAGGSRPGLRAPVSPGAPPPLASSLLFPCPSARRRRAEGQGGEENRVLAPSCRGQRPRPARRFAARRRLKPPQRPRSRPFRLARLGMSQPPVRLTFPHTLR